MNDDSPKHPFHILRHDEFKNSVEKKGKYDYLSWAVCWDKLKEIDPNARYELVKLIHTEQSQLVHVQLHYEDDGDELVHNEYLAVRDFKGQAVSNPDSVQIENTFRRAVAKAVSMATGYGIELWINEDIRDLDYVPNTINGNMPTKGGITPDQRVKLDRYSRSKYLNEEEQAKVKAFMNDTNTSKDYADSRIEQLRLIINKRKSEEK